MKLNISGSKSLLKMYLKNLMKVASIFPSRFHKHFLV